MLRRYAAAIACFAAFALASCGIKGPLKLPPPKAETRPAAAPAATPGAPAAATTPGAPLTTPPPSSTPSAPPPAAPPSAPEGSGAGKQ